LAFVYRGVRPVGKGNRGRIAIARPEQH
jgi:hypothetical protein